LFKSIQGKRAKGLGLKPVQIPLLGKEGRKQRGGDTAEGKGHKAKGRGKEYGSGNRERESRNEEKKSRNQKPVSSFPAPRFKFSEDLSRPE
jgi:hypothetical protein